MLRLIRNRKAQNTMEYALLIAIVVGAFTGMQLYLRRGLHARIKGGADGLPTVVIEQDATNKTNLAGLFGATDKSQYEPYYTRKGNYAITTQTGEGTEKGSINQAGGIRELTDAVTHRDGKQSVLGPEQE